MLRYPSHLDAREWVANMRVSIVPYDAYKKACYAFYESGIAPASGQLFVARDDGGYCEQPVGVFGMSVSWASSQYVSELTDGLVRDWYVDELLHILEQLIDELSVNIELIREYELPIAHVSQMVKQAVEALNDGIAKALCNIAEMNKELPRAEA